MQYCITLRSKTDARITGWYVGGNGRWSTDHKRQKLFNQRRDARSVCRELRSFCPRNAEVINIEAAQDEPSLGVMPAGSDHNSRSAASPTAAISTGSGGSSRRGVVCTS
jgi:hypothetical protein